MSSHIVFLSKRFVTNITLIWFLTSVESLVPFTCNMLCKRPLTVITLIGFLSCVSPFMTFYARFTSKPHSTKSTSIWSLSCVSPFMDLGFWFPKEPFVAIRTLKWPLSGVDLLMHLKSISVHKSLSAIRTLMRSCMYVPMAFQRTLDDEVLFADSTLIYTFTSVLLLVAFENLVLGKLQVTELTTVWLQAHMYVDMIL